MLIIEKKLKDYKITEDITSLGFNRNFSDPIDNLPLWIKSISISNFNYPHPLDFLPESLEELDISYLRSEKSEDFISNLPRNLKKLKISKVSGIKHPVFPPNLKKLYIQIDKISKELLPKTLEKLDLEDCEIESLPKLKVLSLLSCELNFIPDTEKLTLSNCKIKLDQIKVSDNLKILKTDNLKLIKIKDSKITKLNLDVCKLVIDKNYFPETLKYFEFSGSELKITKKDIFPENLEEIHLRKKYYSFTQEILDITLPKNLKSLSLGSYQLKSYVFPKSLVKLSLDNNFRKSLKGFLPESLEELSLGNKYNYQIFKGYLPPKLKSLNLGNKFNQVIRKDVLPDTLETLIFGDSFKEQLDVDDLPQNLKTLELGKKYNYSIDLTKLKKLENFTYSNIKENYNFIYVSSSISSLNIGGNCIRIVKDDDENEDNLDDVDSDDD